MDPAADTGHVQEGLRTSDWFLGVARIDLTSLNFDRVLSDRSHREHCEKNVNRLKTIFEIEGGCDRYNEENYICAVVDIESLRNSLHLSGHNEDSIRNPSLTSIPYLHNVQLDCLHGLHRVIAARKFLRSNDQWWIVKLYSNDMPFNAAVKHIEKYINERPFSDGEIFRNIRLYSRTGNNYLENKWWARLTQSKRKDLKQLLKNHQFASVFDQLVDKRGLWPTLQLGTLHRFLTLRCDEELLHYLRHISNTWNFILGDGLPGFVVDTPTVELLESLAPTLSKTDKEYITLLMSSKKIFKTVHEDAVRRRLLDNILSIPSMIPGLRTFFENLKYIEPCCKILRELIGPKQKQTIRQELRATWTMPEILSLELSEGNYRPYLISDEADIFLLAYNSLWMFSIRHFPDLTEYVPRKEKDRAKPIPRSPNLSSWYDLGRLAIQLGFRTHKAIELSNMQPKRAIAIEFLERNCTGTIRHEDIQIIQNMLECVASPGRTSTGLEFVSASTRLPQEQRCGRPYELSHVKDKDSLFLPFLHVGSGDGGLDITTLFVKRDMLSNLLGYKYFDMSQALSDMHNMPESTETNRHETSTHHDHQELERELIDIRNSNGNLISALHESKKAFDDAIKSLQVLEMANTGLREENRFLKESVDQKTISNNGLQSRIELLNAELSRMQESLQFHQDAVQRLENEKIALEKENQDRLEMLNALEKTRREATEEITRIQHSAQNIQKSAEEQIREKEELLQGSLDNIDMYKNTVEQKERQLQESSQKANGYKDMLLKQNHNTSCATTRSLRNYDLAENELVDFLESLQDAAVNFPTILCLAVVERANNNGYRFEILQYEESFVSKNSSVIIDKIRAELIKKGNLLRMSQSNGEILVGYEPNYVLKEWNKSRNLFAGSPNHLLGVTKILRQIAILKSKRKRKFSNLDVQDETDSNIRSKAASSSDNAENITNANDAKFKRIIHPAKSSNLISAVTSTGSK